MDNFLNVFYIIVGVLIFPILIIIACYFVNKNSKSYTNPLLKKTRGNLGGTYKCSRTRTYKIK